MATIASIKRAIATLLTIGLVHVSYANGYNLRILPVGDSITAGVGSTDGSGYRLDLENLLTNAGNTVDFIGSQTNGATEIFWHGGWVLLNSLSLLADGYCPTADDSPANAILDEGFGFNRISQIEAHMVADNILQQRPNLILLHAGTNDNWFVIDGETYEDAPNRLASFVDYILCHNTDAVLLVAELINNKQNQSQTDYFNSRIDGIVESRLDKGYKINVVDQAGVSGNLLSDLLHPNDNGYQLMAQNWMDAISKLPSSWISTPQNPSTSSSGGAHEICARDASTYVVAPGGSNLFDGAHVSGDPGTSIGPGNTFTPGWGEEQIIAIGTGYNGLTDQYDFYGVEFMDLDGDGLSDYVFVESTNGSVRAWLNKGFDAWAAVDGGNEIVWGLGSDTFPNVLFADLNGDGRDDYIALDQNGVAHAWLNAGPNGDVWLWDSVDFSSPVNYKVLDGLFIFGDLNGDGRADVAIVNENSSVIDIYIQQGEVGTSSWGWQPCPNKGIFDFSTTTSLFLQDIDGDGRADYVAVDFHGGLTGFLNKPGGSCDISWVAVGGTDGIALGARPQTSYVRLADYNGDSKVDYLAVNITNGVVWYWENTGSDHPPDDTGNGGYGSAVRLADLDGDGVDDYISVGPNGEARGFKNGGQQGEAWSFTELGTGGYVAIGVGASREMVQFADMNGDGRADYLVIDPKTGGIHCYLNGGPNTWVDKGIIAIGVGRDGGVGVRLADMNADGRADYIYLDQYGAATVWINAGTGDDMETWIPLNDGAPAAIGVGAQREDVRFADVDGDGLADYIWVHPDTGAAELWYNGSPNGSSWISAGQIAAGVGVPGKDITFARIGTSGRADYVAIAEDTGAIRAWINSCSDVIGSSGTSASGSCQAPPLPAPSPQDDRSNILVWGSIGDSWCSGVAYSQQTLYDGNAQECQRTWEAYTAQMEQSASSWITYDFQDHSFQGCSGSILVDMHGNGNGGRQLISRIPINPTFIIMQAGGNNCGFGDIATKCVYTPSVTGDWGPAYENDPDCTGQCCQALQRADQYINTEGSSGLSGDLTATINDVMGTYQASYEPFWLFIPGYAQFFYVPDGATDDCSAWSFAPWWAGTKFKLSKPLRQRMNQLLLDFNQVYSNTISAWKPTNGRDQRAIYVDIDSAFEGSRFCEAGDSYNDQWYGSNVWFWNLMLTESRYSTSVSANLTNVNEVATNDNTGGIGQSIVENLSSDGNNAPDTVNAAGSLSGNGTDPATGWQRRPFHPTNWGHWAIANKMVQAFYAAGVPGVGVRQVPTPWTST